MLLRFIWDLNYKGKDREASFRAVAINYSPSVATENFFNRRELNYLKKVKRVMKFDG
jgi:hypothetical protein